ncbi:hypothetical protein QBC41DRAFT_390755 [Cercophora samala]|uniref:Uncharacterized protein n=1 Tax=Cercophora samala TaxID=330535 RepID=A0AA39ZFC7_9PEZI|nr:hypothetical protein QBC41DRAFT_390755 [Cercophora samala]
MTKITELTPILEGVSLPLQPSPPLTTKYDFRRILTTTPIRNPTSTLFRRYTLLLSYLLASFPAPDDDNNNNYNDNIPSLSTLATKSHPHHAAELEVQIIQIEKRFDQLSSLLPASISLTNGTSTTTHDITWSSPPPLHTFQDAVKHSLRAKPIDVFFNTQGSSSKQTGLINLRNDFHDGDFKARFRRLWKEIENLQTIIEELLTVSEGTIEIAKGEVGFVPDILCWKLTDKEKLGASAEQEKGGKPLKREVTTEKCKEKHDNIIRIHTLFPPEKEGGRRYHCFTGWLVDNRTVVTVGAAVYNHERGFAQAVEVDIPHWDTYRGAQCGVHWGFFITGDRSFDMGVIRLDREFEEEAEPLKFRSPPYRGENICVTVRGFLGRLDHQWNEMREGTTEVVCDMEDNQRLLDHDVAVAPGSAGSPVMDQGGYAVGMHQSTGPNRDEQLVNKALTFDPFSNRPAAFKVAMDFIEDPVGCMDKVAKLRVKPMRTEQMRNGLCRIQFGGWSKWYKGDI